MGLYLTVLDHLLLITALHTTQINPKHFEEEIGGDDGSEEVPESKASYGYRWIQGVR